MVTTSVSSVRLGLPKGRMEKGVTQLLSEAGITIQAGSRTYRPVVSMPEFETKILKPQDIIEMLHLGSRDVGFAGADWVQELNAEVVELVDTGLDPVTLVAAAPSELLITGQLPQRKLVVASEYVSLARSWIALKKIDATVVRSYGATEVFPPEDADLIVDNSATGSTLMANRLEVIDTLLRSSTRLYANPRSLENPEKREVIECLALLVRSVLDARKRVMVELNVESSKLDNVIAILPCMREATVSPLHGNSGYAVKAAIPRAELPRIIPQIKSQGGTDIVVTSLTQLIA